MKMTFTFALLTLALSSSAFAGDKNVSLTANADYQNKAIIPSKITTECTDLGTQFAQSTKKYLEASGWNVSMSGDNMPTKEGDMLKLEILNAMSSGNAFIGHHKSVAVSATLYRNGTVVDTFTSSRDSSGGFMGGFKGSCSVLNRCVNTLGNDIAKWMAKK